MHKRRGRGRKRAGAVGGGKRGDLLGEREREKKSENERVRSANPGVVRMRAVCVPEKNPYNPIGTMYSCEFARLSGCSRVFGH